MARSVVSLFFATLPLLVSCGIDDDPFFGSRETVAKTAINSAVVPHTATLAQVSADLKAKGSDSAYSEEVAAAWSYDEGAPNGPKFWSKLDSSFSRCIDTGRSKQSPVELFQFRIASPLSPPVTPLYKKSSLTVKNTGNYIRVIPSSGDSRLFYGEKTFELSYIQIHTPAEHQVGGETFPLEVQFYHTLEGGDEVAAMSVLYKQGASSDFLESIVDAMPAKVGEAAAGDFDLMGAIPKDITQYAQGTRVGFPHYTYEGSLTTPPCTEGVRWFVCSKPAFASKEQIDALKSIFETDAARPVQNARGRAVEFKTLF